MGGTCVCKRALLLVRPGTRAKREQTTAQAAELFFWHEIKVSTHTTAAAQRLSTTLTYDEERERKENRTLAPEPRRDVAADAHLGPCFFIIFSDRIHK